MPTDDEHDDLDDGSAGGQIRWQPDNVVAPAQKAPDAPMSWETLFGGDQAPASPTASTPADDNPFTTPPAEAPASQQPSPPPAPGQFQRPPVQQQPQVQQQQTPHQQQLPQQQPPKQQAPQQQPPQQQPPQPQPSQQQPPQPHPSQQQQPQQAAQAPAPTQATPQALGFNPAPSFSNSSDQNRALPAGSGQSNEPKPVIQYFTEQDIENEILREQGAAPKRPPAQAQQQSMPPQQSMQQQSMPPQQPMQQQPMQQQSMPPQQQNAPHQSMAQQQLAQQQLAQQQLAQQQQGQHQQMPPQPMNVSVSGPMANPNSPGIGTQSTQSTQSAQSLPRTGNPPDLAAQLREDDEDGPDLSSVPEIEAGRIWEQRSTKEILMGILKAKKAEYAVALLASTDGSVQGEMLIVKSVVIHGAKLVEPELSGYEALKAMLAIPHGTYTLLDVTDYVDQAQQLEQGLNVRITPLANALPYLPETVDELMGGSNISRIRSKGPVDLENEPQQAKPPRSQTTLRERLPSTKILILSGVAVLALIMMIVVLYNTTR